MTGERDQGQGDDTNTRDFTSDGDVGYDVKTTSERPYFEDAGLALHAHLLITLLFQLPRPGAIKVLAYLDRYNYSHYRCTFSNTHTNLKEIDTQSSKNTQ